MLCLIGSELAAESELAGLRGLGIGAAGVARPEPPAEPPDKYPAFLLGEGVTL